MQVLIDSTPRYEIPYVSDINVIALLETVPQSCNTTIYIYATSIIIATKLSKVRSGHCQVSHLLSIFQLTWPLFASVAGDVIVNCYSDHWLSDILKKK